MPYRRYFSAHDYVGLEVQDSGASAGLKDPTEWFDGVKIDKPDSSVDAVLCTQVLKYSSTQVLEHVELHEEFLGNIFRVLRPGGEFIVTVPFVYEEHEQPFDFRRWTSFGFAKELEEAGFRDLHLEKLTCGLRAIVTLSNQQICKFLSKIPAAASLWMLTGGLVLNLLGFVIGSRARPSQSLFLDLGAVAQKPF
jgi:SAM-dependent methyltransferase